MTKRKLLVAFSLMVAATILPVAAVGKNGNKAGKPGLKPTASASALLWRAPDDIRSRNLIYGEGGKDHAPHSVFTFIKEDLDGTNPKFTVQDEDGVKWKVKMGIEARPEVVASRLVWAVGYETNEDYFLPEIKVEKMPAHLHRGQNLVTEGGTIHNVRLKRDLKDEKKVGDWRWRSNPFAGGKELNGLRVMMALLNNWDLKDVNNSVYEENHLQDSDSPAEVYMVSDLGASFGTTGLNWPLSKAKGNIASYSHSKFISKVTPDYVDFNVPTRPALIYFFRLPEFVSRMRLRWIGKRIPRSDARWVGQLLAQLSSEQIGDAFRAAGYSPDQVKGFTKVVEARIGELNEL
jgi:hypothetical protein